MTGLRPLALIEIVIAVACVAVALLMLLWLATRSLRTALAGTAVVLGATLLGLVVAWAVTTQGLGGGGALTEPVPGITPREGRP